MNNLFQYILSFLKKKDTNLNTPIKSDSLQSTAENRQSEASTGIKHVKPPICPYLKPFAFDLKISKIISGDFSQWKSHRPVGICCASLYRDGYESSLWYSRTSTGDIAEKMTRQDVRHLVKYLIELVDEGGTIVTWNGLGFDFDILAEESGLWEECQDLAKHHIDMMFHILCLNGYPLALDKVAKGYGLSGKTHGMTSDLAPILWQQGQYQKVLDNVTQDTQMMLEVYKLGSYKKYISWMSTNGRHQQVSIPSGWLTVEQAMKLPFPDTSWMINPMKRRDIYRWLAENHQETILNELEENKKTTNITHHKYPMKSETISEDYINMILASCDRFEIYDPVIENEIDIEGDWYSKLNGTSLNIEIFECSCPICMGTPELDPGFQSQFDSPELFSQDYDDW